MLIVGAGLTVKALLSVVVPPPGPGFVTETSYVPSAAAPMVMLTVSCVPAPLAVAEFTVKLGPKLAVVTPLI